jgi:ABC-type microcin C transport system permease subunit YejE
MTQFIKFVFAVFGLLWLGSCAPKFVTAIDETIPLEKLPKKKDKELVETLDSLALVKPKTFYSKLSVDYKDTTREISFKTSLKIVSDSAVNAIITYAKIPIVTTMITKDTIKVVNRKDKCYVIQTLNYIKDNFGIDFTYNNIEELFLGRPLDYNVEQKYFVINDPYRYQISSHRKREKKRFERRAKEDIIINYFLTNDAKELKKTTIFSPSDTTEISVDYLSFQADKGIKVPENVLIQIKTPRNRIYVRLEYEKIEINEPQELIIVIPENYEKCD